MEFIVIFMVLSGFFVAWNTGANDAANCIGVPVGANILKFRRAVLIMAVFVVLGAMLQGQQVMDTIGSGIVITDELSYQQYHQTDPSPETTALMERYFPQGELSDISIAIGLFAAGLSVFFATRAGLPLSTSQSIVGSMAGAGIAIVGLHGELFRISVLLQIFASWIVSPFLTLIAAFVIYALLLLATSRVKQSLKWDRILSYLVIASSCYFAFSLGANAFGAGLGPLVMRFPEMRTLIAASAGIVLGLGAFVFGHGVTKAVGSDITTLDYAGAFAAQFAAGLGLQVFSRFGIPVSSSQAIVGAVVGVGLVKGANMVNIKKIQRILLSWFLTPAFAALLAAALLSITQVLF